MPTPEAAAAGLAAPAMELFGSFMLGADEFALPASAIREVVNFPDKMTALPLSPPFLEGVFTLRGAVIPVVNLGRVFQPDAPPAERSHKIAILDFQQVLLGILFHSTGEILRVRPEQRSTLNYSNGAHGVIAGTILLDHGERLVQVLDPAALARIENVPHVLTLRAAGKQQDSRHHARSERRQCVSFRVGASSFASTWRRSRKSSTCRNCTRRYSTARCAWDASIFAAARWRWSISPPCCRPTAHRAAPPIRAALPCPASASLLPG